MKKLFCIIAVVMALCLCMTAVSFAATADIVHVSVEGTAVIDGVKDDAYANALALPLIQKGVNNGGGDMLDAAAGTAYILNDAEYVYVWFEVYDDNLDNSNSNTWEQDSVEVSWMVDDAKTQVRYHFDGSVDQDSGTSYDSAAVVTDNGYAIELMLPITDVKDNQIEMCLQINACTDGARDCTIYIEGNADGDNAYQRSSRESEYDCWWTLTLAGEHEDTRIDPEDKPIELTKKNYQDIQNVPFNIQVFAQDRVSWGWRASGYKSSTFGKTIDIALDSLKFVYDISADETNNYTTDPVFGLQIADTGYLKVADDAEVGDLGESARFSFEYTDIVLTSEGYDDVVVPGGVIDNARWTAKLESWGVGGTGNTIDFVESIKSQLNLNTEQLCDYMKNMLTVTGSITFTSYEGCTIEDMDAFLESLDAEDEAKVEALQEYVDRVEAAQAIIDDEAADLEAKQAALDDANKAANRATKDAEGYPKAEAKAAELVSAVSKMTKTVEDLAAAEAEPETPTEVGTPSEEKKPTTSDKPSDKPASSSSSSSGSAVTIVIVVIAVVVIAAIAAAVVLGKKKKA